MLTSLRLHLLRLSSPQNLASVRFCSVQSSSVSSKYRPLSDAESEIASKTISVCVSGRPGSKFESVFNRFTSEDLSFSSEGTKDNFPLFRFHSRPEFAVRIIKGPEVNNSWRQSSLGENFLKPVDPIVVPSLMRCIDRCHMFVHVLSAQQLAGNANSLLADLDVKVFRYAQSMGKIPVTLLTGLPDIDLKTRESFMKQLQEEIKTALFQVWNPILLPIDLGGQVFKPAKGQIRERRISNSDPADMILSLEETVPKLFASYDSWNLRVNLNKLNQWMRAFKQAHPPKRFRGKIATPLYVTQTAIRPPTFALFSANYCEVPSNYIGQMRKSLAGEFNLEGMPVNLGLSTVYVAPAADRKTREKLKRKSPVEALKAAEGRERDGLNP